MLQRVYLLHALDEKKKISVLLVNKLLKHFKSILGSVCTLDTFLTIQVFIYSKTSCYKKVNFPKWNGLCFLEFGVALGFNSHCNGQINMQTCIWVHTTFYKVTPLTTSMHFIVQKVIILTNIL